MATFSDILEHYLLAAQFLSGAQSASLFVPDPQGNISRSILVHSGVKPHIWELSSTELAVNFSQNHASKSVACLRKEAVLGSLKPGKDPNSVLLPLFAEEPLPGTLPGSGSQPTAWIGLTGIPTSQPPTTIQEKGPEDWWTWLKGLGGAITRDSIRALGFLNDPVTGLPGRAEMLQRLNQQLENRTGKNESTCVLFVSPDNFTSINELRGLQAGDAVIREVGNKLSPLIPPNTVLVRYGGVVFGIMLSETELEDGYTLAKTIHSTLSKTNYLENNVHLNFSCGIAATNSKTSPNIDSLALIQHANQALNAAKRAGGDQVVPWQIDQPSQGSSLHTDELSGIFTGTMGKDYRNMSLLWNMVGFMANTGGTNEFASKVIESLYAAFRPERVGFFVADEIVYPTDQDDALGSEQNFKFIQGYIPASQLGLSKMLHTQTSEDFILSKDEERLIEKSCTQGVILGNHVPEVETTNLKIEHAALVVPLLARNKCVGCVYMDRSDGTIDLDSSDVHFLNVFAQQIAVALDRSLLAELEKRRMERKRLKLLGEVHELRQALSHAKLVHCSHSMEGILAMAKQVAPTDATVLITGESGTGKGVLADTLHKLSSRKNKPLIMVDCSAISTSLIESELFGHERGAFTGADKKSIGRLADADGGTVFLDEIGELPLEIQSKLLTFVQDRAIVPVGSSKSRKVDVRIVAATNRELEEEVDAGRFRRDLYYRLNVVTIHLPPLRDRSDDILLLARHFLERYNVQYHKSVHGFSSDAEIALRRHPWPGNIRELQNRIMRAIILCNQEILGPLELGFAHSPQSATPAASTVTTAFLPPHQPHTLTTAKSPQDPWQQLKNILGSIIQRVDGHRDNQPPPFGKWLEDDLVEIAYDKVGGIHRRGASLLGIPETTFRRRMKQIQARTQIGPNPRTPEWVEVCETLERITASDNPTTEDWILRSREILLTHVISRFPARIPLAAALMGVTEPTIHRWRSKLTSN